ncbi:GNAT family N-acetyltransferase [Prosthecodimorpha staleyi]|uniref:GNAT family N-acetyltransferase n=1 Tax=Prosthecodimorpha staleyi TaxID=2840188 RepID=A0A947D5B9_9HYPH|nr:GNAT family N-acetyltransferase [Prosthecodimorpha staleyi]MBT9291040.1 GNAT family N-acetyltransferase [Prosthecodimorpha staleyi]
MSDRTDPTSPVEDLASLIVETARLVLRQPTRDDAERLAELANDIAIAENLSSMPHPYSVADALAFIDNTDVSPLRVNFGIYAKDDAGRFIGTASLMPRDGERFVVGYWIGRPHWGLGYATEATQAMVDLAFDRLDAPSVSASCRVTNGASRRVLEKSGFQYAGQGMGPSLFLRGMVPVDRFRIERPVWKSLRAWRDASVARREATASHLAGALS